MSTNALPDLSSFGIPVDPIPVDADTFAGEEFTPRPIGVDLAFDFLDGNFVVSAGNDFVLSGLQRTIQQWVITALLTPRGAYIIYPENFGSELSHLMGLGLPLDALAAELPRLIEECLLYHDRIEDVANFEIVPVPSQGMVLVNFDVILDDATKLRFQNLSLFAGA